MTCSNLVPTCMPVYSKEFSYNIFTKRNPRVINPENSIVYISTTLAEWKKSTFHSFYRFHFKG